MLKLNTLSGFGSGVSGGGGTVGSGWWCGGSPGLGASAQELVYATHIVSLVTTADLSAGGQSCMGVTDLINAVGYFCGGNRVGSNDVVDKLVYATKITAAATSADLPDACEKQTRFTSDTAGYLPGGSVGGYSLKIVKLTYSTATSADLGSGADIDIGYGSESAATDPTYGWINCKYNMNKTNKSSDTTAVTTAANLPRETRFAGSVGTQTLGYGYWFGGGDAPWTIVGTCDRCTFATDTTAALTSGDLPTATYMQRCENDSDVNAWLHGGVGDDEAMDLMPFATEITAVNTTAALPSAKAETGGVSTNQQS
tara:strand:+ start:129 stop:1064 length:936 start_codon:yes stop_codon:yes gene_type:complete